jgi:hypothetical protein
MLKRILLAVVPLALLSTTVFAEEDLLNEVANLKVAAITDAQVSIEDPTANLDVDSLSDQAGSGKSDEAIEACFRRFGYGGYYGGYSSYCYSPYYSYTYYCYQPYYQICYRPVYYYTSYWGCW